MWSLLLRTLKRDVSGLNPNHKGANSDNSRESVVSLLDYSAQIINCCKSALATQKFASEVSGKFSGAKIVLLITEY